MRRDVFAFFALAVLGSLGVLGLGGASAYADSPVLDALRGDALTGGVSYPTLIDPFKAFTEFSFSGLVSSASVFEWAPDYETVTVGGVQYPVPHQLDYTAHLDAILTSLSAIYAALFWVGLFCQFLTICICFCIVFFGWRYFSRGLLPQFLRRAPR